VKGWITETPNRALRWGTGTLCCLCMGYATA